MPPTPSQRPALLFVPCSQRTWCNRCCWGLGRPSLWVPGTRARERRAVRCGHQGTRVKTKRPEAKRQGMERRGWGWWGHWAHFTQPMGRPCGGEGRWEAGKERGQHSRPEQLRETTGSRGPGPGHDAHPIPEARSSPQPQPWGPPRACFPHGWQVSGTASHPQPTVGAGGRKEWQGAPAPLSS